MNSWEKRIEEIRQMAAELNSQKITLRDCRNDVERYIADLVEQSELDDPDEIAFLRGELERLIAVDEENAAMNAEFVVSYDPAPGGAGDEDYFEGIYEADCEYLGRVEESEDIDAALAALPEVSGWDEEDGPVFGDRTSAERYAQVLREHGFNARVFAVYR